MWLLGIDGNWFEMEGCSSSIVYLVKKLETYLIFRHMRTIVCKGIAHTASIAKLLFQHVPRLRDSSRKGEQIRFFNNEMKGNCSRSLLYNVGG